MSSSKRGRDGRDGKTKHDIFVAAESLKSILHSFGLQTGREFPTAQLISARLLDLKKITTANHKMISKLVAMEVRSNYFISMQFLALIYCAWVLDIG